MLVKNRNSLVLFRRGLFHLNMEERAEKRKELLKKTGDLLEEKLSDTIEGSPLETPVLAGDPELFTWYRIPLENGLSGDGSEYHIYLKKGCTDNLCIFFSGGGLAWNAYTAARPITAGSTVAWEPNYYYSNLRPSTQLMNIGSGIMDTDEKNPFHDWNFIVIPYATGDFHIGRNDFTYPDEDGTEEVLHFHGYTNFVESMMMAQKHFSVVQKLLVAGDSAGGFAASTLSAEIVDRFYKDVKDVTVLSDASLLIYDDWKHTIRDLWKAPSEFYDCVNSDNVTLDWYRETKRRHPEFRCLYAGSTHDYILSTYYNDVTNKQYGTDKEVQNDFFELLKQMIKDLRNVDPEFGFFLHEYKNALTKGGTVHTSVRKPWFYRKNKGVTMAEWLYESVNGNIQQIGLEYLED